MDKTLRVVMTGEARSLLGLLDRMGTGLQRVGGQGAAASRQVDAGLQQVARRAEQTSRQLDGLRRLVGSVFAGLGLAAVGRQALVAADDYTGLIGRVGLYTDSQRSANQAMEELFQRAQRARTPLVETGSLYVSLAGSADELSASQQDLMRFVSGVSAALAINKTASATAAGGLLQLGQMMGGPIVQAQEFNSLIDAMRPLLVVVAKNLDGAGGSVSRLKTMVNEGKVATKDFFAAALAGSDELTAKMEGMQSTVGRSVTRMGNAWMKYIGDQDQARGSTAAISAVLDEIADNFEVIADTTVTTGAIVTAVVGGRMVGALTAATGARLRLLAATVSATRQELLAANAEVAATTAAQAHTAALVAQARSTQQLIGGKALLIEAEAAHTAAATANTAALARQAAAARAAAAATTFSGAAISALGGPVGLIVTALIGLSFWFATTGEKAEQAGGKMARSLDDAKRKAEALGAGRRGSVVTDEDLEDVANLTNAITTLATSYSAVQASINSGESLKLGRLAEDAQAAESLLAQMADLREMQEAILRRGAPKPAEAAPGASETTEAEASLNRLRASLQAASALQQAQDERRAAQLDERRRQHLVGDAAYFQARAELERAANRREVSALQAQLAQLAQLRAAAEAEPAKTDEQRDARAKKLAETDAERVRLQGQINVLREQELAIGERTQADIDAAAEAAAARMSEVRARLAQVSNDALAVGEETRRRLEREYAAELAQGSEGDKAAIRRLIDREALQAEFDAIKAQTDNLTGELRQRWDSLSQSVQAGTLGTAEAQAQFADALAATNPDLQGLLARLTSLAERIGPEARKEVAGLSDEMAGLALNTRTPLQQLAAEWNDVSGQIHQAGVSAFRGIANELTALVTTGKADFGSMALAIVQDLVRIMIQAQLTKAALEINQLFGLVSAGLSAGAGSTGGGGGSIDLNTGAGASVSGNLGAAFAKGGAIRGPGTETSDSILLWGSNGEYMLQASAVRSLGEPFLDALNERGIGALQDILDAGRAPAYATGGLVGTLATGDFASASRSSSSTASLSLELPLYLTYEGGDPLSEEQVNQLGKQLQAAQKKVVQDELAKAISPRGVLVTR